MNFNEGEDGDEYGEEIEVEIEVDEDGNPVYADDDEDGAEGEEADGQDWKPEAGKKYKLSKTGKGKKVKIKVKAKAKGQSEDKGEEGEGEGKGNKTPKEKSKGQTGGLEGGHGEFEAAPTSQTQEAFDQAISATRKSGAAWTYITTPEWNYEEVVDDYTVVMAQQKKHRTKFNDGQKASIHKSLSDWRTAEQQTISYMVKEFDMRKAADVYARTSIAKSGVLNTNKLHSYLHSEDIFKRHAIVSDGKNHGFVMVIDWSGSMQSNLMNTVQQLLSLVLFCKRVGIPFEVFLFRDFNGEETTEYNRKNKQSGGYHGIRDNENYAIGDKVLNASKQNPFVMANSKLRNVLSSRMNTATMNDAMFNLWAMVMHSGVIACDNMTGTPLNQSIYVLDKVVEKFKKHNKVQIVSTIIMTDGEATGGMTYRDDKGGVQGMHYGNNGKHVLTDDKTRHSYDFNFHNHNETKVLLDILKSRVGGNLIGIYLCGDGEKNSSLSRMGIAQTDEMKEIWDKQNFVSVKQFGYDAYFLVKLDGTAQRRNMKLDVDSNTNSRDAARKFQDFTDRKLVNRVLLRQFIDIISKESKHKIGQKVS